MNKTINGHIVAHYRDNEKLIEFCKVCGREELELYQAQCKGIFSTENKPEKFVSGLPKNS